MAAFESQGVRALARASSTDTTLSSVKKDPDPSQHDAAAGKVAGLGEALASVVPVAVTGVYTTVVLILRGFAESRGADSRAKVEAALTVSHATKEQITKEQIAAALKRLPVESQDLIVWRWAFLGLAGLVVVWLTVTAVRAATSTTSKQRWGLSETFTAFVAFAGWSLVTPGTPLAAYHDSQSLLFFTAWIAGVAALVLAAAGTNLTKKAA